MHDGIPMITNETPSVINGDNDINCLPFDRLSRQYPDIIFVEEHGVFESVHEYDG
jgi:hypothetical protein